MRFGGVGALFREGLGSDTATHNRIVIKEEKPQYNSRNSNKYPTKNLTIYRLILKIFRQTPP